MAAPLQTYLFENGKKMAGKKIGVIVSSHSSGISGVVADAKRLIPGGDFIPPSLWIRSAETANCKTLIAQWLKDINYQDFLTSVEGIPSGSSTSLTVYNLNGLKLTDIKSSELSYLPEGIYIVKGADLTARKLIIK